MEEDHARMLAAAVPRGQEELAVNHEAIGCRKDYLLRNHLLVHREIGGGGFGGKIVRRRIAGLDRGAADLTWAGAQKRHCAVGHFLGRPFDSFAEPSKYRRWRAAPLNRHAPDMAAVDVVLVGRIEQLAAIAGQRNVLDFEVAWSEQPCRASLG